MKETRRESILTECLLKELWIQHLQLNDDDHKNINNIIPAFDEYEEGSEVDLVISGGGLCGYYMIGAMYVLRKELERRNLKLGRVSGASAGAWCGFFILGGLSNHDWIETYYHSQENSHLHLATIYENMWENIRYV